jgi:hypothetical protein
VRVVDDGDSPIRSLRRHRQLKAQAFAASFVAITRDQFNRDDGFASRQSDLNIIRPGTRDKAATRSAFTAGIDLVRLTLTTEHRLSQKPSKLSLANAIRSRQHIRMRQPSALHRTFEQRSLFLMTF